MAGLAGPPIRICGLHQQGGLPRPSRSRRSRGRGAAVRLWSYPVDALWPMVEWIASLDLDHAAVGDVIGRRPSSSSSAPAPGPCVGFENMLSRLGHLLTNC